MTRRCLNNEDVALMKAYNAKCLEEKERARQHFEAHAKHFHVKINLIFMNCLTII